MTDTTQAAEPTTALATFTGASACALLMSDTSMDRLERLSVLMASGKTTVPQHLRGSSGDCFAICLQSMQWGMNPFAVAQKTHLVNGTLGYEAQLVAAVINNSKVTTDRFHFEWFGPWEKVIGKFQIRKGEKGEYRVPGWSMSDEEGCGIKVWATLKGEREPRVLSLLLAQARVRNSTLWADDPKQQLAYLAQKRWARLYAPDVILGVYTNDELAEPDVKFMGMVDEVGAPPTPPNYEQADFDANLPKWTDVIATGRKTHADLIHFIEAKGKPLTEAQKKALMAIKVIKGATATDVQPKDRSAEPAPSSAPAPAAEQPATEARVKSYAEVADLIAKADTHEALDGMDEHIGAVANAQHREELSALLAKRKEDLPF